MKTISIEDFKKTVPERQEILRKANNPTIPEILVQILQNWLWPKKKSALLNTKVFNDHRLNSDYRRRHLWRF